MDQYSFSNDKIACATDIVEQTRLLQQKSVWRNQIAFPPYTSRHRWWNQRREIYSGSDHVDALTYNRTWQLEESYEIDGDYEFLVTRCIGYRLIPHFEMKVGHGRMRGDDVIMEHARIAWGSGRSSVRVFTIKSFFALTSFSRRISRIRKRKKSRAQTDFLSKFLISDLISCL